MGLRNHQSVILDGTPTLGRTSGGSVVEWFCNLLPVSGYREVGIVGKPEMSGDTAHSG